MKMKFTKMHGCGNDYVYVDCMDRMLPNPGKISEFVSRRRFGIGSDGLICICPSDKADFRMRMFNADASEGKMCGNGSRCIAKYVYDKGLTRKDTITLESQTDIHALFQMTPYYWKTPRAGAERLAALETLTTRISFRVHIFRKL